MEHPSKLELSKRESEENPEITAEQLASMSPEQKQDLILLVLMRIAIAVEDIADATAGEEE